MTKIIGKLEQFTDGVGYWCPGCEKAHYIRTMGENTPRWGFNGDYEKPTFTPSVKVTGKQSINKDGEWTGEYVLGPDGKALDLVCHVFVTDGVIQFLSDSTHKFYSGKCVPLTNIPEFVKPNDR